MATTLNKNTRRQTLIEGTKIRCPRCRSLNDLLTYKRMEEVERFKSETVPINICRECNWKFAIKPDVVFEILRAQIEDES